MLDYKTEVYGLIGNPVEKSLSPIMHNDIYEKLLKNRVYLAFNVKEEDLESAIGGMTSLDIKGFNVTIPHKIRVMEYLDELTDMALKLGAVNTIKNLNGRLIGHNTDGDGLIQAFEDEDIDLDERVILLLGAGGASFGILGSILFRKNPKKIYILNRTYEKSLKLKDKMDDERLVVLKSIDELKKSEVDILINSTSVGMYPKVDESPIDLDGFMDLTVFDAIYKPLETRLLKEGKAKGFKVIGGIEMLLNQGLLAQSFWDESFLISSEDKNKIRKRMMENI